MTTPPVEIDPIPVRIIPQPKVPETKEIHTTFQTVTGVTLGAEGAVLLLPHSPKRMRATLAHAVDAGKFYVLAGSKADAQAGRGARIDASSPYTYVLGGTDEVWIGLGTLDAAVTAWVSAIAEFDYS